MDTSVVDFPLRYYIPTTNCYLLQITHCNLPPQAANSQPWSPSHLLSFPKPSFLVLQHLLRSFHFLLYLSYTHVNVLFYSFRFRTALPFLCQQAFQLSFQNPLFRFQPIYFQQHILSLPHLTYRLQRRPITRLPALA